ncbi:MAG: BsuPI-related putative proteinase inhibitor [Gemmatimonadota bacterium]
MERSSWMGRVAGLAVALAVGCSTVVPLAEVAPGSGSPPELGSSFNVSVGEDSVRLELHVTNVTSAAMALEFTSSQRYDFAVATTAGEVVWRWAADRSFMQALGAERLEPGESRRYTAVWPAPGRQADYVATAWLTSQNYPVELRTVFRLPDG